MAKRMKKTYAIHGYMEFVARIPLAAGRMLDVPFTGGKQNGYGVTPARFSTDDPVLQKLIEKSPMFRAGRITKYS